MSCQASPAIDQTHCVSARAFHARQADHGLFNAVTATYDLSAIVTTTTSDDDDDEDDEKDYVDAVDTSPHTLQDAIDYHTHAREAQHGSAFTRLMYKVPTTTELDDELAGQCPEIDGMLAAVRGGPSTPPPNSLLPPVPTHPSPRRSLRKVGTAEGRDNSASSYTPTLMSDASSFTCSGDTLVNHNPLPPSAQNVLDEPFVVLKGDISILRSAPTTPLYTPSSPDTLSADRVVPPAACSWDAIDDALNKLSQQHNVARSTTTKKATRATKQSHRRSRSLGQIRYLSQQQAREIAAADPSAFSFRPPTLVGAVDPFSRDRNEGSYISEGESEDEQPVRPAAKYSNGSPRQKPTRVYSDKPPISTTPWERKRHSKSIQDLRNRAASDALAVPAEEHRDAMPSTFPSAQPSPTKSSSSRPTHRRRTSSSSSISSVVNSVVSSLFSGRGQSRTTSRATSMTSMRSAASFRSGIGKVMSFRRTQETPDEEDDNFFVSWNPAPDPDEENEDADKTETDIKLPEGASTAEGDVSRSTSLPQTGAEFNAEVDEVVVPAVEVEPPTPVEATEVDVVYEDDVELEASLKRRRSLDSRTEIPSIYIDIDPEMLALIARSEKDLPPTPPDAERIRLELKVLPPKPLPEKLYDSLERRLEAEKAAEEGRLPDFEVVRPRDLISWQDDDGNRGRRSAFVALTSKDLENLKARVRDWHLAEGEEDQDVELYCELYGQEFSEPSQPNFQHFEAQWVHEEYASSSAGADRKGRKSLNRSASMLDRLPRMNPFSGRVVFRHSKATT